MQKLRVLVVEDEPSMSELLTGMLYKAGTTKVTECDDAQSARTQFDANSYDIIMLDLGLPDGDGHELMAEFKTRNPAQHIVLVTANDSIESIQRAISAGANGYVIKPYSQEKIVDVVNNYALVHGGEFGVIKGPSRPH